MRIVNIFVLVFSLLLCSCVQETGTEPDPVVQQQYAQMRVDINNESSLSDDYREVIQTVRIIVFNNASTNPKLDVNTLNTVTAAAGTSVSMDLRVTANDDKMIVAIINEPSQMSGILSAVTHPSVIEDLDYDFAHLFNTNHTAMLSGTYMPMTGVKRGVSVNSTHTAANPMAVSMTVERIVARVDVYLMKSNMTNVVQLTSSTAIRFKNTYTKGYFAAGTAADGTRYQTGGLASQNFGRMMTVGAQYFTAVSWSPASTVTLGTVQPTAPTCSFYTPERTCSASNNADKLALEFSDINIVGIGARHGEALIYRMSVLPSGVTDPLLTEIKRNNVYAIIGTVKSQEMSFEAQVLAWNDDDLSSDINNVYFLDVSKNESIIERVVGTDRFVVKTDYPGGWSAVLYNDPAGLVPVSPSGWMTLSAMNGGAVTSGTEVIITLGSGANVGESRYIKFTAGRKTLTIKVTVTQ